MVFATYDDDTRGRAPPPAVLALLTTPAALRARAEIREAIALQDHAIGDSLAAWRNEMVAQDMRDRARKQDAVA
jgi:hypothetical protein